MFRLNKRVKNTINAVAVLLFSAIFFALAYKGYKKQKIDLSALATITGEVEDSGTDYSGGKVKSRVFFIKFKNLHQALGVSRKDRDYTDLVASVRSGDVLTAYFIPGSEREKINTDLVQLEKNSRIVLSKEIYGRKQRPLIYIGLIGGVVCVVLACFQFKQRQ